MYTPKPPSDDDPYAHLRADKRHTVLRAAEIHVHGHELHIECVVRDISKTGMRVLVDQSVQLPARFDIILKQTGRKYVCVIRWRNEHEAGVQFEE